MILFIGTSFCQQFPAEQSLFYHFCQVEAFNFVRCDKISNFCSIRRTFFKKALAFSSEKCYLVSNKSGSRIQRLRRALHPPRSWVHPSNYYAIFFIYLLIIYPVPQGTEKAPPQPAWGSAFFCFDHDTLQSSPFGGAGRASARTERAKLLKR